MRSWSSVRQLPGGPDDDLAGGEARSAFLKGLAVTGRWNTRKGHARSGILQPFSPKEKELDLRQDRLALGQGGSGP